MNHYTYWIYANKKHYIGVRSCKCEISDDTYYGSQLQLKQFILEGGTYEKHVLGIFSTREEAAQHEVELHALFDVGKSPLFWNRAKATTTKFSIAGTTASETTKKLLSLSRTGEKNHFYGKTHSEEARQKIANRKNTLKGVPKSPETRERMSKGLKGRVFSEEHRRNLSEACKGRIPWNKRMP